MASETWRPIGRVLGGVAVAVLASCSVADNLSFDEIVTELDGIVSIHQDQPEQQLVYAERAEVSTWYVRQWWLWPLRPVLGPVFGWRAPAKLPNASEHVRALLAELPDETGGDLLPCALAAVRMAWIAELATNGSSRIVALDGLAAMAEQLHLELFGDPSALDGVAPDADHLLAARAGVQVGRPEVRGKEPWDDARLTAYSRSLAGLVEKPLADWAQRISLVEDLIQLRQQETDARALPATDEALRAAIGHCVTGAIVREVRSRDPGRVEVRLGAMQRMRQLGGPGAVPLLLSLMAASPAELGRGEPRYDADPLIQLRLIQYCGQLRGELATHSVKLPGRADWEALAPVDFLAQTILNEQTYYSPLRVPATIALSLALERNAIEHDQNWVRAWWIARQGQS